LLKAAGRAGDGQKTRPGRKMRERQAADKGDKQGQKQKESSDGEDPGIHGEKTQQGKRASFLTAHGGPKEEQLLSTFWRKKNETAEVREATK